MADDAARMAIVRAEFLRCMATALSDGNFMRSLELDMGAISIHGKDNTRFSD
jgi:hypothetical protein